MATENIAVSEWGLQKIRSHASAQALTFVSHYGGTGLLSMHEFNEMERWRKLAADLKGDEFKPITIIEGAVRDWNAAEILPPENL